MKAWLLVAALLFAGCACKQPKPVTPDPPVRVKASRCHPLVEGVACTGAMLNFPTICTCTGDV